MSGRTKAALPASFLPRSIAFSVPSPPCGTTCSAVSAAIAVQRALAEHRRSAGFAPRVRIGLHATEATRVGESYVGQGVHQAARIGAIAGGSEIVASAETLLGETFEGVARPPQGVELKGIPGTVEVQIIDWGAGGSS